VTGRCWAFCFLYSISALAAVTAVALAPVSEARVAVVAWPGARQAAEVVAAAGGRLVRPGIGSAVAVAVPDGSGEGFITRLYRNGALLVLAPGPVEACL
jgi:hypothetical protein